MAKVKLLYYSVKDGFKIYLDIAHNGKRQKKATEYIVTKNYAAPLRDASGKLKKDKNGNTRRAKILDVDKKILDDAKLEALKLRLLIEEEGLPNENKQNANFIEFFEDVCKNRTEKNKNAYSESIFHLKDKL